VEGAEGYETDDIQDITREELQTAVKKASNGEIPGLDKIPM
jgi:hypothetical protein